MPNTIAIHSLPNTAEPSTPVQLQHPHNLDRIAASLLLQLGIPAHVHGYRYLLTAVLIAIDQPDALHGRCKQLYSLIAAHCDTTAARVERSMRHAISLAWDRSGSAGFHKLLSCASQSDRPGTCEFVALVVERIRIYLEKR